MVLGYGRSWEVVRDKKRAERSDKIEATRKKLEARTSLKDDLPYLSADVSSIVHNITVSKEWTSLRVLEAYIRAAIRAHEQTNCLTEIRFEEALAEAKKLDADFASHRRPRGPLHGVPISLKDSIDVQGYDTSLGASSRCDQPAESDAIVVTLLREAGAIVGFAKTAIPQTLLSFECSTPIWGITTNPYSSTAVPGGSSGGEAALIAMDASPAGLGSDIGGSCRIPASFSGCFGLKTCPGRVPMAGHARLMSGFEALTSSIGPLGRTVQDLELVAKVLIQGAKTYWHSEPLVPLPWRDHPLPARLKIGYYRHDNFVETSPACLRAVHESVDALKKAGHELIELPPPDNVLASVIFTALTSAGGQEIRFEHIQNDPKESFLFLFRTAHALGALRKPLGALVGATLDKKMPLMTAATGQKSVAELWDWQAKRNEFALKMRTDLWHDRGLDGVIAPVQSIPALGPGESWNLLALACWTYLFNVVECAVGVVPVTFVRETDERPADTPMGDYSPITMAATYGSRFKPGVYNPRKMQGLPVGVQVVGPAYGEERVLRMMGLLDAALGERGYGPGQFVKRKG